MRNLFILTAALITCWLTLSGYFKPMLLGLGGISIGFVLWMCKRMDIIDTETVPYAMAPRSLLYFRWLFKEIVKANIQVITAVLRPDMEVTPTLVRVPMPQKTDLGKVMFANSITLTPGTVSVNVDGDDILVHALLAEMSNPDDFAEMSVRSGYAVNDDITQQRAV